MEKMDRFKFYYLSYSFLDLPQRSAIEFIQLTGLYKNTRIRSKVHLKIYQKKKLKIFPKNLNKTLRYFLGWLFSSKHRKKPSKKQLGDCILIFCRLFCDTNQLTEILAD